MSKQKETTTVKKNYPLRRRKSNTSTVVDSDSSVSTVSTLNGIDDRNIGLKRRNLEAQVSNQMDDRGGGTVNPTADDNNPVTFSPILDRSRELISDLLTIVTQEPIIHMRPSDAEGMDDEVFHSCRTSLSRESDQSWMIHDDDDYYHLRQPDNFLDGCAPIGKIKRNLAGRVGRVGRWVNRHRKELQKRNKQQAQQRQQQQQQQVQVQVSQKKRPSLKKLRSKKKKINPSVNQSLPNTKVPINVKIQQNDLSLSLSSNESNTAHRNCLNEGTNWSSYPIKPTGNVPSQSTNQKSHLNVNEKQQQQHSQSKEDIIEVLLLPSDHLDTSQLNEDNLDEEGVSIHSNGFEYENSTPREEQDYSNSSIINHNANVQTKEDTIENIGVIDFKASSISDASDYDYIDNVDKDSDKLSCDIFPIENKHSTSVRDKIEEIESKPNAIPMPKPQSFLNSFLDTQKFIEDKLSRYYNDDGIRPKKPFHHMLRDLINERRKREYCDNFFSQPPFYGNNVEQDKNNESSSSKSSLPESSTTEASASISINNGLEPVAEKAFNNILKIVFIGAPQSGKSSIIQSLLQSKDPTFNPNQQTFIPKQHSKKPIAVETYKWDPHGDDNSHWGLNTASSSSFPNISIENNNDDIATVRGQEHIKYSIWDLPGGTEHSGAYEAVQSLFFSSNTLFVLVWDMGAANDKTFMNRSQTVKNRMKDCKSEGSCDSSGESSLEDDDSDDYSREMASRKADRSLERNIHEKVIFWIECVRKRAGSNSAIMPVAAFEDIFDEVEAQRRCAMMKKAILRNQKQQQHVGTSLDIIFAANNDIPRVSSKVEGGTDRLKQTIMNMTSIAPLIDGHVFGNHLHVLVPSITTSVEKVLDKLIMKREKVVSVDKIRNILRETYSGKITRSNVKESLKYLSSVGKILYFSTGISSELEYILSHFVILDPKWIVAAIGCILQPSLKKELMETRNRFATEFDDEYHEDLSFSFINEQDNPVIITSQDITMMWESLNFMLNLRNKLFTPSAPCLFTFLKCLMVQHGIIVPFEPSVTKHTSSLSPCLSSHFFLPSQLPQYSEDFWSFKCKEAWKTTLCHTWQIQKSAPIGLMQDISISILKEFSMKRKSHLNTYLPSNPRVKVRQVLCWKNAFWIDMIEEGAATSSPDRTQIESRVTIFGGLFSGNSKQCVASGTMPISSKKLVLTARGPAAHYGQKIWKFGYYFVLDCIDRYMKSKCPKRKICREVLCPQCLKNGSPHKANSWAISSFEYKGTDHMVCKLGHTSDTRLLLGCNSPETPQEGLCRDIIPMNVTGILESVVLVALWDDSTKQIVNVGSGFIADKRNGLIITASHVLFDMDPGSNFGNKFFGLKQGKVIIGHIPSSKNSTLVRSTAFYNFFAEIVSHDVQNVDACVLRLTTKFLNPVGGNGKECEDQPETSLQFKSNGQLNEELKHLKLTTRYELDENVRILGFNQGGEGIFSPGMNINRTACTARGYVCMRPSSLVPIMNQSSSQGKLVPFRKEFVANQEIVVICPTIEGHSGGPIVNSEGKVIGILSRSDRNNRQRCYLVPSQQLKALLKEAQFRISRPPIELYMS